MTEKARSSALLASSAQPTAGAFQPLEKQLAKLPFTTPIYTQLIWESASLVTRSDIGRERFSRLAKVSQFFSLPIKYPYFVRRNPSTTFRNKLGFVQINTICVLGTRRKPVLNFRLTFGARTTSLDNFTYNFLGSPKHKYRHFQKFLSKAVFKPRPRYPGNHSLHSGHSVLYVILQSILPMSSTGSKKRKLEEDATKYYAVKAGHTTGIFERWADCQKNITGFKGAVCESPQPMYFC